VSQNDQPSYNASGHSFSGWLGGKAQLARTIVDMMPAHNHYCEVFAGAAWVLFKKTPSKAETINDINGELINLYRIMRYHFEALLTEFELQLNSRDEFYRLRNVDPSTLTDIQRAGRFYYLLRTCYGARIQSPTFASSGTRPIRLKLAEELREHLGQIHQRLQKVTIENQSYDQLIPRMDCKNTLFYIDPPYYDCENYYGKGIFGKADFYTLRDLLKGIKGKFILSLNDVPEVREIFKDFKIQSKQIRWSVNAASTSEANGKEVLITNF
jgi:DNA adenine methylase